MLAAHLRERIGLSPGVPPAELATRLSAFRERTVDRAGDPLCVETILRTDAYPQARRVALAVALVLDLPLLEVESGRA